MKWQFYRLWSHEYLIDMHDLLIVNVNISIKLSIWVICILWRTGISSCLFIFIKKIFFWYDWLSKVEGKETLVITQFLLWEKLARHARLQCVPGIILYDESRIPLPRTVMLNRIGKAVYWELKRARWPQPQSLQISTSPFNQSYIFLKCQLQKRVSPIWLVKSNLDPDFVYPHQHFTSVTFEINISLPYLKGLACYLITCPWSILIQTKDIFGKIKQDIVVCLSQMSTG